MRPEGLCDRDLELQKLRELATGKGLRMALLTGRRRVGKTYLLQHAWDDRPVFHFTASNISPAQNRRRLVEEADEWTSIKIRPEDHPTWRSVFRELLQLRPETPIVVVLDEFQYLSSDPGDLSEVTSELNAAWESPVRREAGLLLVLCGSAVSTLEGIDRGGAPLYGRIEWHGELDPFDYLDASKLLSGFSREDHIQAYAAFGGTPFYLDALDTTRALEDQIIALALAPDGFVRHQLETAIEQEIGLRKVSAYRGILASVGQKRRTAGEIAASLGRKKDTGLRNMLSTLMDLGYLERDRNFGAARRTPHRYRIDDPAFRFHYGLVVPRESAIDTAGAGPVWRKQIAPRTWPTYVGQHVFEDVVKEAFRRKQRRELVPPVEEWGRWEGLDRTREPVEIDVVSRLLDGRMLTGSVKYRSRAASATVWTDHVEALQRLQTSGKGWAREALEPDAPFLFVSRSGFASSFDAIQGEDPDRPVIRWSLSSLWEGLE